MISLTTFRKIEPEVVHLEDGELEKIRSDFYGFGELLFDDWYEQKFGSKFPLGSLTINQLENKI